MYYHRSSYSAAAILELRAFVTAAQAEAATAKAETVIANESLRKAKATLIVARAEAATAKAETVVAKESLRKAEATVITARDEAAVLKANMTTERDRPAKDEEETTIIPRDKLNIHIYKNMLVLVILIIVYAIYNYYVSVPVHSNDIVLSSRELDL